MTDFLFATAYILLLAGAGSAIGNWLLSPRTNTRSSAEPLGWGWSYLIGAAAVGLLLYVPLAVRGRISRGFFLVAVVACAFLTLWHVVRQFSMRRFGLAVRRIWIFDLPWPLACLMAAVVLAGLVSVATTRPNTFDARSTFLLKARLLYDVGTIQGEDFQDVDRMHFNAHYPLLIPLHEATIFRLQRSMSDRYTRVLFFGFVIAILSVIARELRRFQTRRNAALITAALACTPLMIQAGEGGALTSSVDVPLACYILAGALACMNWLRTHDSRQTILAALMLGAGVLTKSEGAMWVMAAGAAMLGLVLWGRLPLSWSVWRSCTVGVGLLVVMLAVFMAVRRQIPYSPYLRSYMAAALDGDWLRQLWLRPLQVIGYVLYDTTRPRYWNFAWVCVIAALCLRRKSPLPTDMLFSRVLLAIVALAFFAIFLVTPYHVYWQMSTAMHRLSLQLLPLAWIVAAESLTNAGWIAKFESLWNSAAKWPSERGLGESSIETESLLPLRRAG